MVSVRFDDLRPHRRRSFALQHGTTVLEASTLEEVPVVVAEAENAVRSGYWVGGFVTYEAAPAFDPVLAVVDPGSDFPWLPLAWFVVADRRGPAPVLRSGRYSLGKWEAGIDRDRYFDDVNRIRQLIRVGETYQVNYTFRARARFSGSPEGLYRDLVNSQACGYGALIETEPWAIVSASPELFFEWKHGRIVSKPMKGTIRRGLQVNDDESQRASLESSEKDQAENLMIVDMVRNDLGRVARTGSVQVPALFTTEKYDTVWQLTSTVEAEPRPGMGLADVFEAIFPSASITGAPKVRTMEIIADLEARPRGIYCGAIGFGGPGAGDEPQWAFNVAIRTVAIDRDLGEAHYGTGGGITYGSTPEGEWAEARLKTAVLARQSSSFELLETIRWTPEGGFWLLDRHLARLADSARYFDVALDQAEVRAALRAAVDGASGSRAVRLTAGRTGRIEVGIAALPSSGPVQANLAAAPVDPADVFLYHKTTNRRTYDEARTASPGSADVILHNPAGELTETTIANLAVRLDDRWVTPPIECGLLPGTYRAELLYQGCLVEERVLIEDLVRATAVARFNALRGWEPLEFTPSNP